DWQSASASVVAEARRRNPFSYTIACDPASGTPVNEAHSVASARDRAIAGDIVDDGKIKAQLRHRAGDRHPILHFRGTGLEDGFIQRRKPIDVAIAHRVQEHAIDILIDDEMAEAARSDECDPRIALPRFDRPGERLAEIIAAADG